jgi:hypothetical protein
MPYYDTIEEDLIRAKRILDKGKPEIDPQSPTYGFATGGTIYGADTFAAYKLLESFVAEIERYQRWERRVQRLVGVVKDIIHDLFPDQQIRVREALDHVSRARAVPRDAGTDGK